MNQISLSAVIADDVIMGKDVTIGERVVIKSGCVIGDNVVLEDDVYIDYATIIYSHVTIKCGGTVGARCILGEHLADFYSDRTDKRHPLVLGENAMIRSENIIYGDTMIGDHFQTGHRVTIREKAHIGNHVRVGTLSDIQGDCVIEDYVNMHSNVHVGQKSVVKKYVWLFPYVVLTNDPNPPSESLIGVTIEEYAVISTGSILLPGIHVGSGALVGAGAIVTKNIDDNTVALGNPARMVSHTEKIKDKVTGKQVYPWPYTFDRGMPWQGQGYDKWKEELEDENITQ